MPAHVFASLRSRLAVTYAGLALLAVLLSSIYTATTLRGLMIQRVGADLVDEAGLLADGVRGSLASGDAAAVAAYIQHQGDFTYAKVRGKG